MRSVSAGVRRGLARYRRLPAAERRTLLRAGMRFGLIMVLLRTVGVQCCLSWMPPARARASAPVDAGAADATVNQLVLAVARAYKLWGRGACLDRALTLCWLLRRAGYPAEVRFGVRKQAGDLDAHAWVECEGRRLGDDGARGAAYAAFAPAAR